MNTQLNAMKQALAFLVQAHEVYGQTNAQAQIDLRIAIEAAEKQEPWLQAFTDKIEAKLLSHRLSLHDDAEDSGTGYLLVYALCCGQKDLEIGKQEIKSIVEVIYHVLAATTPPNVATSLAAQPASCPHGMVDTCCENYGNCNLSAAQPAPKKGSAP